MKFSRVVSSRSKKDHIGFRKIAFWKLIFFCFLPKFNWIFLNPTMTPKKYSKFNFPKIFFILYFNNPPLKFLFSTIIQTKDQNDLSSLSLSIFRLPLFLKMCVRNNNQKWIRFIAINLYFFVTFSILFLHSLAFLLIFVSSLEDAFQYFFRALRGC